MYRGWVRWGLRICRRFAVLNDAVRWTRRVAIFDKRARGDATSMGARRANGPQLPVDRSQIPLGGSLQESHRPLYDGDSCLFSTGQRWFFGAVHARFTSNGLFTLVKLVVGKYDDRCMRYCLFFGNLDYGRHPGGG